MYDANRPAILKWNLMGLGMDGNWYVCVRNCDGETVPIHAVTKRVASFLNILMQRKNTVF